mmetsp:Transcript_37365/g.78798  ORF Transcript_37365/g.78798 Transcript_37365/m.78798 type:complete len:292 (-) Transcript_37365:241-1116(-)
MAHISLPMTTPAMLPTNNSSKLFPFCSSSLSSKKTLRPTKSLTMYSSSSSNSSTVSSSRAYNTHPRIFNASSLSSTFSSRMRYVGLTSLPITSASDRSGRPSTNCTSRGDRRLGGLMCRVPGLQRRCWEKSVMEVSFMRPWTPWAPMMVPNSIYPYVVGSYGSIVLVSGKNRLFLSRISTSVSSVSSSRLAPSTDDSSCSAASNDALISLDCDFLRRRLAFFESSPSRCNSRSFVRDSLIMASSGSMDRLSALEKLAYLFFFFFGFLAFGACGDWTDCWEAVVEDAFRAFK